MHRHQQQQDGAVAVPQAVRRLQVLLPGSGPVQVHGVGSVAAGRGSLLSKRQ